MIDYDQAIEAVKNRFEPRIRSLLEQVIDTFRPYGYAQKGGDTTTQAVDHEVDEEHWWFATLVSESCALQAIGLQFTIVEQKVREDTGEPDCRGVNFMFEVEGGGILTVIAPFNYTPECWVSVDNEDALEERFRLTEELVGDLDVGSLLDCQRGH